jgi:hypothetical protein
MRGDSAMMPSTSGKIAGLLMISLVVGSSSFAEAAQSEKGKTTKPPAVAKEGSGALVSRRT